MTDINASEDGASSASASPLHEPTHQPPTTSDRIRLYGSIGTNEALARLGDPDAGDARSSSATLELDSVTSGGPATPPRHRRMTVGVTLSVSNDGSCPPPPGTPLPPCPPHNPTCPSRSSSRWPWIAIAVLVLVLCLVWLNQLGQNHDAATSSIYSSTANSTTATTAVGANSTPPAVPNSPTIARLDDAVMPGNTVIFNQVGELTCDGDYHTLNQIPEFAIVHTHNWVHDTATQWRVRCYQNLGGATVVALDANRNVINRQIYGANFQFESQFTFVQSTDAAGFRIVQVDVFVPFNTFIGRTIYRFDSSNRVSDAYRQDGFQRPLQSSHITRNEKGEITSVTTELAASLGSTREAAFTKSDIEASTRVYYDFDSFN